MISANNYRELLRIQKDVNTAEHLVEEAVREEVVQLLTAANKIKKFSLEQEFQEQYNLIKLAIDQMGGQIQTKEDLDIIKEGQKYLLFIMRQEEKMTNIKAVREFKESVLEALDEVDPILKDKVLRRLHEKSLS